MEKITEWLVYSAKMPAAWFAFKLLRKCKSVVVGDFMDGLFPSSSRSRSRVGLLVNSKRYSAVLGNWLCGGLFLFVVGYFVFPTANQQRAWFYISVLLPTLLLIPALSWRCKAVLRQYMFLLLLSFYLWLTQFWSAEYQLDDFTKYTKRLIFLFALFGATAYVVNRYKRFQAYLFPLFFSIGALYALIELWQYFSQEPLNWRVLLPDSGRYGNQNRLAQVYGIVVVLGVAAPFLTEYKKYRTLALLGMVPALVVLLLTRSSSALVSVLTAILAMPVILRFSKRTVGSVLLLFVLAVCFLYFSGLYDWFVADGWSKRDVIWLSVLSELEGNFWFGQGVRSDMRVVVAGQVYMFEHNLLLAVLRYGGVVGLTLLGVVLMQAAIIGLRASGCENFSRLWLLLLLYGFVALFVTGIYPLTRPNETWLLLWVPLAFLWASKYCRRPDDEVNLGNKEPV